MATLCLADDSRNDDPRVPELTWAASGLREWLDGDWGLLFSHPEDFQDRGFECDRWLAVMRAEFQARGVRPLACAVNQRVRDGSWASALTDDWRLIKLHAAKPRTTVAGARRPPAAAADDVVDLAARVLRADICELRARFVMIVDPALRRRGVLRYGAGGTRVSPLDLLASIGAMRRAACELQRPQPRAA
ncbi:MAG TPA: hypothetical protein VHX52_12285 [Steroidobacteraceae bacterium]|jgi:alkyl hydroperoxide reductase subunit AhpC|nr:hypothetical protein [Steroidobacteraceae bacterium]